jgi:hypothetical protein
MHSNYHPHVARRHRVQARAISLRRNAIPVMIAYAVISAVIALWMAYLPFVTGSILSGLNIVPDHRAAFSSIVNRENKGDRLAGAAFDNRWSIPGNIETQRPTTIIRNAKPFIRTELASAS